MLTDASTSALTGAVVWQIAARAVVLLPVKFRAQREVILTGSHRELVAWS